MFRSELHTAVRFEEAEDPDLEGFLGSQKVICEVKRINVSRDELGARNNYTAGTYEYPLRKGFVNKLEVGITKAKDQIHAYDPLGTARHIVYLSIDFDDGSGGNREVELREVEQYFGDNPPGVEYAYSAWS